MKTSVKIIAVVFALILLGGTIYYFRTLYRIEREAALREEKLRIIHSKDSVQLLLMADLDEIDNRLDSIRDSQGYLVIGPGSNFDLAGSKKHQILNNISMLRNIITDNRKKMEILAVRLKQVNNDNSKLQKKLSGFNKRNEEAWAEVELLKQKLEEQGLMLGEERDRNASLTKELQDQTTSYTDLKRKFDKVESDAYTAYYITGTKKQLQDLKVIEKKKMPLVNIGYSQKSVAYFPSSEFERVDARDEAIIPLHTKKAILITPHDKQSYTWQDDDEGMKNLCIVKPAVFWQSSKFLVIETK